MPTYKHLIYSSWEIVPLLLVTPVHGDSCRSNPSERLHSGLRPEQLRPGPELVATHGAQILRNRAGQLRQLASDVPARTLRFGASGLGNVNRCKMTCKYV